MFFYFQMYSYLLILHTEENNVVLLKINYTQNRLQKYPNLDNYRAPIAQNLLRDSVTRIVFLVKFNPSRPLIKGTVSQELLFLLNLTLSPAFLDQLSYSFAVKIF